MKWCSGCKANLPEDIFQKNSCKFDGLSNWCKFCAALAKRKYRSDALEAYGKKCECCGELQEEFLTIDHVHGGGRAHAKEVGAGTAMFQWLKRNGYPKEDFRVLCYNCNCSLGAKGYCPHELLKEPVELRELLRAGYGLKASTTLVRGIKHPS